MIPVDEARARILAELRPVGIDEVSLLEAQGRVLAASDVGGHKELIRDGETGRLFAAGQVPALVASIQDMLAHRERWPAMRTAGRHFVESVRNWKNSVANYKAVYGRLAPRSAA